MIPERTDHSEELAQASCPNGADSEREMACASELGLSPTDIATLREFFELLDQWDCHQRSVGPDYQPQTKVSDD